MDFGLATCKDSSTMIENICGTPFYMGINIILLKFYEKIIKNKSIIILLLIINIIIM